MNSPNLRHLFGFSGRLCEINREERNLGALLFHFLNLEWPRNLQTFLRLVGAPFEGDADTELYFEYAYLRDLWHAGDPAHAKSRDGTDQRNAARQSAIIALLGSEVLMQRISSMNCYDFNAALVGGPISKTDIQSPGRWSIEKLSAILEDNDEFRRASMLKWAFNSKPDIVVQARTGEAVCVELKLDSIEGVYPTSQTEKDLFSVRKVPTVRQIDLQRHMMCDVLGIDAQFVLINRNGNFAGDRQFSCLSWKGVFDSIGTQRLDQAPYIQATLQSIAS